MRSNHFSRSGRLQIRDTIVVTNTLSEWSGLDLRHLVALDAIAHEGSVSRAATSLGYTQSAVSQQLQALERIVGVTLVTRSPGARAVELTDAGRQLLTHADAIAGHLDTARADPVAFTDGRVGEARTGTVPRVAGALIPALAEELRTRAPRLTLAMTETYFPAQLLDALAAGDLDLVLAPRTSPARAWSPRRSCVTRRLSSCRRTTPCSRSRAC